MMADVNIDTKCKQNGGFPFWVSLSTNLTVPSTHKAKASFPVETSNGSLPGRRSHMLRLFVRRYILWDSAEPVSRIVCQALDLPAKRDTGKRGLKRSTVGSSNLLYKLAEGIQGDPINGFPVQTMAFPVPC